ncbi:MAG: hypothetical protein IJT51_00870 [Bacteroidales bacterium]|nr:hypothetical protein [Bacteroidales bacterium]
MAKKNDNIRYGRCVNPECSNVGISDIIPENGNCPFCDKPMELDEDEPPGPGKGRPKWPKYVAIACATLVVIGGAIYGIATHIRQEPTLFPPRIIDPVLVISPDTPNVGEQTPVEQEVEVKKSAPSSIANTGGKAVPAIEYGVWTGRFKNNQPDGTGTMTYKIRHRIDPRDVKERVAEVGDYIIGEFSQGKLIHGVWYDKNNKQKDVLIFGK